MKDLLNFVTRPLALDLRASIEARYEAELARISEDGAYISGEDGRPYSREDFTPEEWQSEVLTCFAHALCNTDNADLSSLYINRTDDSLPSFPWFQCYSLDWKAAIMVELDTRAIARQLGLPLTFKYPPGNPYVSEALPLADAWFRAFGYALMFIDTEGDDYLAFPVRIELMDEAERRVQEAGFRAWSYSESRR